MSDFVLSDYSFSDECVTVDYEDEYWDGDKEMLLVTVDGSDAYIDFDIEVSAFIRKNDVIAMAKALGVTGDDLMSEV